MATGTKKSMRHIYKGQSITTNYFSNPCSLCIFFSIEVYPCSNSYHVKNCIRRNSWRLFQNLKKSSGILTTFHFNIVTLNDTLNLYIWCVTSCSSMLVIPQRYHIHIIIRHNVQIERLLPPSDNGFFLQYFQVRDINLCAQMILNKFI